jgi:type IV pilus assembly protein PilO
MEFDFEDKIEKLAKIPKPIRLAVVSATLIAIVVGYYLMFYQPQQIEVDKQHAKAQQLQRQLNKVRVVATHLKEFEQEVADLERELDLALTQLPDRKQFEDLLRDISTAGKRVGVTIKSLQRQKEVKHDFYAEVPFSLELQGNYHDIALFFERVSRLPRIVNVGKMSLKVGSQGKSNTILNVKGRATTFRFLGEREHAVVDQKSPGRGKA